jgi:hypothetical protein
MKISKICLQPLKIVVTIFILVLFSNKISAQNNIQVISPDAVKQIETTNMNHGQSRFQGLNVQYAVSVDQLEGAKQDASKFISIIKNIPGVIDCTLDVKKLLVYVNCPKEDGTDYLAAIKSNLDQHNIKMLSFKEFIYKK